MEPMLDFWLYFRLCVLSTLISGAMIQAQPSFAQAPGDPVSPSKVEALLETLPDFPYERLDLLEKHQAWLKNLEKKDANNAYVQALLGLTFFKLADTRKEMGVNAIDYWAYIDEMVEPLQSEAKKHFNTALSSPNLSKTVRAWSHYYRGVLSQEYDPESTESDYKKACELGYTKACQSSQESEVSP